MEADILKKLNSICKSMNFPNPLDGRKTLKRNPSGRNWKLRNVKNLKGMVWHQELGWGSIEGVARYHTSSHSHLCKGGVESISYTFAIRRNGQIVLCNDLNKATWSQGYKGKKGDENVDFLSVMFEGLFHGQHITNPSAGEPNYMQIMSAMTLWHVCKGLWKWNELELFGHYHMGKPSCPGNTLKVVIDAIRANVTERKSKKYDFNIVKDRQQALIDLGYLKGKADGIWGPISRGALVQFQKAVGLAADGILGANTQKKLMQKLDNTN